MTENNQPPPWEGSISNEEVIQKFKELLAWADDLYILGTVYNDDGSADVKMQTTMDDMNLLSLLNHEVSRIAKRLSEGN